VSWHGNKMFYSLRRVFYRTIYFLFAELSLFNNDVLLLLIFLIDFSVPCLDVFQKGLWQVVFNDPDLQSLSARLQTTILSARAPVTVSMYDRAFRRLKEFALKEFALSQGKLPRLPTAAWASEFFRGTGGGRAFRPRMAMSKTISLLGFRSLSL